MKFSIAVFGMGMLIAVSSCARRPPVTGRFLVRGALPKFRAAGRVAYTGYVVNISGPGITPTVGAQGLGHYAPGCVDVGVSSNVLSYERISTEGALVKVAAGPARKIQIFGVSSSLEEEVLNKPVTALFDKGRVPELYSLVKVEGVDIFTDRKIELSASASAPTQKPVDVLRSCFSSDVPVEALPESAISGVRIAVITLNSVQGVNSVSLDLKTGTPALVENLDLTDIGLHATASPDRRSLLVWNSTSGKADTFALLNNGRFDRQGSATGTAFMGASSVVFKAEGQYGFTTRSTDLGIITLQNGAYTTAAPSSAAINPQTHLLSYGANFFRLSTAFSALFVDAATIPEVTSNFGFLSFKEKYSASNSSNLSTNSLINSRGIYLNFASASPVVQFLKFQNSAGDMIPTGSAPTVGTSLTSNRMAVSPDGKFLFVLADDSGGEIRSYVLNEDGSLPPNYSGAVSSLYCADFTVDPTSKYLILGLTNGPLSGVKVFTIKEDGQLTNEVNLGVGIGSYLRRVIALPVR